MKCFEKLFWSHIQAILPLSQGKHQFVNRANRSTEDAVTITVRAAASHPEQQECSVRILVMDYSSAFNTLLLYRLMSKLTDLGLSAPTCHWILNFLTGPSQRVRVSLNTSPVISDSPQGCVPSPLLYSLYTYDYASTHPNNTIIKFADYMTLDGLISSQDESVYRDEVKQLSMWCKDNNLALNISNTKELVIDFRMNRTSIQQFFISDNPWRLFFLAVPSGTGGGGLDLESQCYRGDEEGTAESVLCEINLEKSYFSGDTSGLLSLL